MSLKRFVKWGVIFFLTFILLELVYYIFLSKRAYPTTLPQRQDAISLIVTDNKLLAEIIRDSKPKVRAITETGIALLIGGKKDILTSSIASNTYKGKIVEFTRKQNSKLYDLMYDVSLTLESRGGSRERFFYRIEELENAKIISILEKERQTMSISDLKIGDNIIIDQKVDLLRNFDDNLLELSIYKTHTQ